LHCAIVEILQLHDLVGALSPGHTLDPERTPSREPVIPASEHGQTTSVALSDDARRATSLQRVTSERAGNTAQSNPLGYQ